MSKVRRAVVFDFLNASLCLAPMWQFGMLISHIGALNPWLTIRVCLGPIELSLAFGRPYITEDD